VPLLQFFKNGLVNDEILVGNFDRPALHALMAELGLKRDESRTYEKLGKEQQMADAFMEATMKHGDL
jgi:hypothetical protein